MLIVPCFPWEVSPTCDSFPEISEASYTITKPEDQLIVSTNPPSVEASQNASQDLAAGILTPGGCPQRQASLRTESRHLVWLTEGINANTNTIQYLRNFGHHAIQHHHFFLGNHHVWLNELQGSVQNLLGYFNTINTINQDNFQQISNIMSEYHSLLNFLCERNISINKHLGPFIDNRVQFQLPNLDQVNERLANVEASCEASRINPCDAQFPCETLRHELDSLDWQYSDLVTRVAQLVRVSPDSAFIDHQIQESIQPLSDNLRSIAGQLDEVTSQLGALEAQITPFSSHINLSESLYEEHDS